MGVLGFGAAHAATPPKIVSARILSPTTIDVAVAPGQPRLAVEFTTGPAGLNYIQYGFTSESGAQSFSTFFSFYDAPTSGMFTFQQAFNGQSGGYATGLNLYSEPGSWHLGSLMICDNVNNCAYYEGSALTALVPHPDIDVVNNGTPDTKPPYIGKGAILTPTVKRTGYFKAQLTVGAGISGITSVEIFLSSKTGGQYQNAYALPPSPLKYGTVEAGWQFPSTAQLGTWTIYEVEACNVATACTVITDATKLGKMFGGKITFTVAK